MGVVLRWVPPDPQSEWTQVRIYRESSSTGPFVTIIATLPRDVDHYFDVTGSSGFYYKISFYDSVNSIESALSDVVQGGDFVGYCTPEDIYSFTNVTESKVDSFTMAKYIESGVAAVNEDIQVKIHLEKVGYISDVKENLINGVNTTFYTKNFPIGDMGNDGEVSVDDLEVFQVEGDGTRTQLTVSSITPNTGAFVLSAAPDPATTNIARIELNYHCVPVSVSDPHRLVRDACMFYAASLAYSKINLGKAKSVKFGTMRFLRHMESVDEYMKKYDKIIYKINYEMADKVVGDNLLSVNASIKYGPRGSY